MADDPGMTAVHEARLRVRLDQHIDYRAGLSNVGQQALRDAPGDQRAKLVTDTSSDKRPWQWELSDCGLKALGAQKDVIPDRKKDVLDQLLRDAVRTNGMSSFQRAVDKSEQGSPEAELTLVFLIEKALCHKTKGKKPKPPKAKKKVRAHHFKPNAKTGALMVACATELKLYMNATEAASVFELLCSQLDQFDALEGTEKYCRELFAKDSQLMVSNAKAARDEEAATLEEEALAAEAAASASKLEPEREVGGLSAEDLEELEEKKKEADRLNTGVSHVITLLKGPRPRGYTKEQLSALASKGDKLVQLLSNPVSEVAQLTLEWSQRDAEKERIEELAMEIGAVADGAAEASTFGMIAEYLKLVEPPVRF